jgi:hypothetical protein
MLAGPYDNPMPTWFLVPIAGLKLPTLNTQYIHMYCTVLCKFPIAEQNRAMRVELYHKKITKIISMIVFVYQLIGVTLEGERKVLVLKCLFSRDKGLQRYSVHTIV